MPRQLRSVGLHWDRSNHLPAADTPSFSCPTSNTRGSGSDCPHWYKDAVPWNKAGGLNPGGVSTVPQGKRVLLSGCMLDRNKVYSKVVVPANSELIIDDQPMYWRVGHITVQGRLRIGSKTCRTINPIVISFENVNWIDRFEKGIFVKPEGALDLHGKSYTTWRRLKASARKGSAVVRLQSGVNWQKGQLITIATTIWKDEVQNQNEVAEIKGFADGGTTVYLQKALNYNHFGGQEYQAEVGLLSRTLVIQGAEDALWDKRGPHIFIQGEARFSGVLFYRMGQMNVNNAYPVHYHMTGDSSRSFVSDCAFYYSFFRCVTLHATQSLTINDNVAFHITGSCMYAQTGVEENNYFTRNLVMYVHIIGRAAAGALQDGMTFSSEDSLINPADSAASCFYASNPNNAFKDNAASGGWAGFSFPVLAKPILTESWRNNVFPFQRPLQLFDGNTAHSSGYMYQRGATIYFGGRVWQDSSGTVYYNNGRHEFETLSPDGTLAFMHVTNTKVFLTQRGLSQWGQRMIVTDYEAHDITRGVTVFGSAVISDALINRKSTNAWSQFPGNKYELLPIAGFQWYDTNVKTCLSDVTFLNYRWVDGPERERETVWFTMTHSDKFKPSGISLTSGIKYLSVDYKALMWHITDYTSSSWFFNFYDSDGSAVRRPGRPYLIGSYPAWWKIEDDRCTFQWSWNLHFCQVLPWHKVARIDIRIPWYTSGKGQPAYPPTEENTFGYMYQFGYKGDGARFVPVTRNEGTTGVTGSGGWFFYSSRGATPRLELLLTLLPPGHSIMFSTRYPTWATLRVSRKFKFYSGLGGELTRVNSRREVALGDGTLYHYDNGIVTIKLVDPGDSSIDPPLVWKDNIIYGERFSSLFYVIEATNLKCSWSSTGPFCGNLEDKVDKFIPNFVGDHVVVNHPSCVDVDPPGDFYKAGCYWVLQKGRCKDKAIRWPSGATQQVRDAGGYCGVTCGACSEKPCTDISPDDTPCRKHQNAGKCNQGWFQQANHCQITCGRCPWFSADLNVVEVAPDDILDAEASLDSKNVVDWENAPTCSDKQPSGGYTCSQHAGWGKCDEQWMLDGFYCEKSCNRCPLTTTCADASTTPGGYTCAQQKSWGKCAEQWMQAGRYCDKTCGFCGDSPTVCTDVPVPGGYSCIQQKSWGKCDAQWVKDQDYCAETCGRCTSGVSGVVDSSFVDDCSDERPEGALSCEEYKDMGQCEESWMELAGYCNLSCGRCISSGVCSDDPPADGRTCQTVKDQNTCNDAEIVANLKCRSSCGRCEQSSGDATPPGGDDESSKCSDYPPPGGDDCAALNATCSSLPSGTCDATCGRC